MADNARSLLLVFVVALGIGLPSDSIAKPLFPFKFTIKAANPQEDLQASIGPGLGGSPILVDTSGTGQGKYFVPKEGYPVESLSRAGTGGLVQVATPEELLPILQIESRRNYIVEFFNYLKSLVFKSELDREGQSTLTRPGEDKVSKAVPEVPVPKSSPSSAVKEGLPLLLQVEEHPETKLTSDKAGRTWFNVETPSDQWAEEPRPTMVDPGFVVVHQGELPRILTAFPAMVPEDQDPDLPVIRPATNVAALEQRGLLVPPVMVDAEGVPVIRPATNVEPRTLAEPLVTVVPVIRPATNVEPRTLAAPLATAVPIIRPATNVEPRTLVAPLATAVTNVGAARMAAGVVDGSGEAEDEETTRLLIFKPAVEE